MCMTLAASHPHLGAIIAVDRRFNRHGADGHRISHRDIGGRLARFGSGWIAGAGNSGYIFAALTALAQTDCGDVRAVSAVLKAVAAEVAAEAAHGIDAMKTFFVASDGSACTYLEWRGTILDQFDCRLAYPGGFNFEQERHWRFPLFHADYKRAFTTGERVRRVAQEFAKTAVIADTMSPTMEIAVGRRYLSGDAAGIANMDDATIQAALTEPPKPRLDRIAKAMTEMLATCE